MHHPLICEFIFEFKSIQRSHSMNMWLYMVTPFQATWDQFFLFIKFNHHAKIKTDSSLICFWDTVHSTKSNLCEEDKWLILRWIRQVVKINTFISIINENFFRNPTMWIVESVLAYILATRTLTGLEFAVS